MNNAPQDILTMAAKRLGEAKAEANARGMRMLEMFKELQKEIATLKTFGLSVTTVEFEDRALQAAWRAFTADHLTDMPVMEHEDVITLRAVSP